MILYRPTDGSPHLGPLSLRPRCCFVMTQLGGPPDEVRAIRRRLGAVLRRRAYSVIDADSAVTGRDFLLKIWEMLVSVPLGIAVIHESMRPGTIANVFYELGLMQACGKETLVVKSPGAAVPSDFVRTEYVEVGDGFEARVRRYLDSLDERARYYSVVAEQLDNNPLLAIDYLRRAYLLTRDAGLRERMKEIFGDAGLTTRARDSVERLLLPLD